MAHSAVARLISTRPFISPSCHAQRVEAILGDAAAYRDGTAVICRLNADDELRH
jgi:hypothetical protein